MGGGQKGNMSIAKIFFSHISQAVTDKARKDLARTTFSNPVFSDPACNLTFHGFKGRHSSVNSTLGSFNICEGQRIPLAGAKRKDLDSNDHSTCLKVVKFSDFGQIMQGKYAEYFVKGRKKWFPKLLESNWVEQVKLSGEERKNLLAGLTSLRETLQENENFLQYYSDRKVQRTKYTFFFKFVLVITFSMKGAFLSQNAAFEALDLEETSALSYRGSK